MSHPRFQLKTLLIATAAVAVVLAYVTSWMRMVRRAIPEAPDPWVFGCYEVIGILLVAGLLGLAFVARHRILESMLGERLLPFRIHMVEPGWNIRRILGLITLLVSVAIQLAIPPTDPGINSLMVAYYLAHLPEGTGVLVLGILCSLVFLLPRVQKSYPVLWTENEIYLPGFQLVAWKWLQRYEWVDQAAGRLNLVAPAAYAWFPIKLTVHPEDVDAVDEFLSGRFAENRRTRYLPRA